MKNFPHTILRAFLVLAATLCAAQFAGAQDPVKVDPQNYTVLQETPHVRILEFRDKPGYKGPKHYHPDYFVVVLSDATRLFTTDCVGPGTTVKLTAGEVIKKDAVTHCEANTGDTDTHVIVIELTGTPKQPGKAHRRRRRS